MIRAGCRPVRPMARRGWVCTLTIYLKPGSYQVTCPLDNHAAMDMQVDLLVTG